MSPAAPSHDILRRLLDQTSDGSVEEFVRSRLGVRAPHIDEGLLSRVLSGLGDGADLPAVEAAVLDLATIGETFFLRHRDQLDWIESTWLPRHLAQPRAVGRPIRVLFAACSTGQEVWSFLSRLLPRTGAAALDLVAVDVCTRALAVAERGRYGLWSLRGTSPGELEGWLDTGEGAAQVAASLLSVPRFVHHNLLDSLDDVVAPGSVDLILCRNMLMYLHEDALQVVWDRLARALSPQGALLTAVTDPEPANPPLARTWVETFPLYARRGRERGPAARRGPPVPAPPAKVEPRRHRTDPVGRARTSAPRARGVPREPAGSKALLDRARAHAHGGQTHLARVLLEDLLSRHPFDVDALVLDSLLAADAGKPQAAIKAARAAVYLAPDEPYPHYVMAAALLTAGRRPQADRVLRATVRLLDRCAQDAELGYSDGMRAAQLREVICGE